MAGAPTYNTTFGHEWFVGKLFATQQPLSIAYTELFPVVGMATLQGPLMGHKTGRDLFWQYGSGLPSAFCIHTPQKYPNMMIHLPWPWLYASLSCSCFDNLPPPSWAESGTFSFFSKMAVLFGGLSISLFLQTLLEVGISRKFLSHNFRIGAAMTAPREAFLTTSLRPWVTCQVKLITSLYVRTPMDTILLVAERIS